MRHDLIHGFVSVRHIVFEFIAQKLGGCLKIPGLSDRFLAPRLCVLNSTRNVVLKIYFS